MRSSRGVAVVAGCLIGILSGCSASAPSTSWGKVDKDLAASSLSAIESQWLSGLASEDNLERGEGARCYFLTDGKGENLLVETSEEDLVAKVGCGPVRRLGVAEGHVWDSHQVQVSPSGDDTVGFGAFDDDERGQMLTGVQFWRPDGETPSDNASELAAPPAPAAEPGLVQVLEAAPDSADITAINGQRLITPAGSYAITGVGKSPLTTLAQADPETGGIVAPAPGEEFAVVRLRLGAAYPYPADEGFSFSQPETADTTTQVYLVADGKRREVKDLAPGGSSTFGSAPAEERETVLVAAVPQGAKKLELVTRTLGVEQSLDLMTGRRTSTTAAGFYRADAIQDAGSSLPTVTKKLGSYREVTSSARFDKVVFTAWDKRKGWAPKGKAWLELTYTGDLMPNASGYEARWRKNSFVANADGSNAPYDGEAGPSNTLVWTVPADSKTVAFSIAPVVDLQTDNSYTEPAKATLKFGSTKFTITID